MAVKLVIGEGRFSFPHVFEPWKPQSGDGADKPAKYSITILIPKSNTEMADKIKKAVNGEYEASVVAKWGNKRPADWFNPLQDGDSPKKDGDSRGEEYKGHWFITAKSTSRPGIVDAHRQPIICIEDFYAGCYGYLSVAFGGYNNSGSFGISCFLNNVMKTRDGEPLGAGKTSAEQDFADIEVPFDAPVDNNDIF